MKRLLLVAYYFPPLGGGGVQRPLQWVRALPQYGWLPTVLTVEEPYWSSRDEAGLGRVPPEIDVVRTPYFSAVTVRDALRKRLRRASAEGSGVVPAIPPPRGAFRRALVDFVKPLWQTPDEFLGWYPFAVRAGKKLLETGRFDAIVSTAPPYTTHWIARALRRHGSLPWVADFRDGWTLMPQYPHTGRLQLAIERRMERAVLRGCDALIATTEPTAADFAAVEPSVSKKVHVIPNGYDPELYAGPSPYLRGEKLEFLFTGTTLLGQDLVRFAERLSRWIGEDAQKHASIRIRYAGPEGAALAPRMERTGAATLFEDLGYLSNIETAKRQRRADVLLFLYDSPESARKVVPGKLFEYLAAARPILAVSPSGPATAIVSRAKAGWVLDPSDEAGFQIRLDRIWRSWREGVSAIEDADRDWIAENFERPRQVRRVAALLDSLRGRW